MSYFLEALVKCLKERSNLREKGFTVPHTDSRLWFTGIMGMSRVGWQQELAVRLVIPWSGSR